jgi:ubiquinone/menaquinone biosynthesis C-methylase UbiE
VSEHAHDHDRRQEFQSESDWAEWVRDYYRDVETYDWVDVADQWRGLESIFHRNRRRAIRRLIGKLGAEPPMLDAGCGTGLNLASLPVGSVGIDINPRNLALIRQRLPDHRVVEGDIEAMPFEDNEFGTVICTEVLEHIPHPDAALSEIRRVLRPGGQLIGSVPSRSLIWRLRFLSSTCPRDEPFHNEYRKDQVAEMLVGFSIIRIWQSALHFNVMFNARKDYGGG